MNSGRQQLKWLIYALLFIDFLLYLTDDVQAASYTLSASGGLFDYARAYVTSIDLAAWFTLIILFELETYVLSGRSWPGRMNWLVRGLRLACYATILHTSFAYDYALHEFQQPRVLPQAEDACQYAEGGWSFLRNRDYIELDHANCARLGRGPDFFAIGGDRVITDRAGLHEGLVLAWTDLIESIAWLVVVFATELAVRLKLAGFANAAWSSLLTRSKSALYALILLIAFYWGFKAQYLYLWDELIWVCAFLVIDRNLDELRTTARPRRSRRVLVPSRIE